MDADLKEAVKLLIECADELRKHEWQGCGTYTTEQLKHKLRTFFAKHGLTDPATVANVLCIDAALEEAP